MVRKFEGSLDSNYKIALLIFFRQQISTPVTSTASWASSTGYWPSTNKTTKTTLSAITGW